ncbi:MAG: hypothetical protein LBO63_03035 [Oscillospiraceae bacterium]|jgi:hypothetical protein|nr:hypothetical protein [Oscillospiraceae bacterium]
MHFSIFEIGMLVGFGFAWPVNIYKSITSRTAKGKSVVFLWAIWLGYVCGITHKILYSRDIVLALYLLNIAMVSGDIVMYYINRRRDRAAGWIIRK